MQRIGLFRAKSRLSELVDRAAQGEEIGITRRCQLAAVLVPARPKVSLKKIFIEGIRKRPSCRRAFPWTISSRRAGFD